MTGKARGEEYSGFLFHRAQVDYMNPRALWEFIIVITGFNIIDVTQIVACLAVGSRANITY